MNGFTISFNDIYYKNNLKGILGPFSFPCKAHLATILNTLPVWGGEWGSQESPTNSATLGMSTQK